MNNIIINIENIFSLQFNFFFFLMYQPIGDLDTHCIEQSLHHITQAAPDIRLGGGQ